MAASATGQRAQQTQLEVGSQPRNPRARVAVTDQAMGWEQREGPRGSRKGPEFSRFVSCGLDSPALVTQPGCPPSSCVDFKGHLAIPVLTPVGHQGQRRCCPRWQRAARQEKQQTGGPPGRQGGARSPAAFRVGGGGRRHGRGGRADSPVGFEKDPTLLSPGIRTSNKESLMKSWDTAQGWKGP